MCIRKFGGISCKVILKELFPQSRGNTPKNAVRSFLSFKCKPVDTVTISKYIPQNSDVSLKSGT